MTTLGILVGDVDEFGSEIWGRAAFHRAGRGSASPVPLSVDDVDRILTSAVRVPAIRIVRDGERVEPTRFCAAARIGNQTLDDVADPRKVLDEYRRGATVVLQTLHRTWAPLSAWCAGLEAELGWPVQCNAYLSPPNTTGLAKHADGHDVFAVQLHGTKHWFVDGIGELTMCAGDVLYMPSGVEHIARTERDASLHLTVGVHRPTPARLARTALATVASTATMPPVPIGADASLANALAAAVADARTALDCTDEASFAARLRRPPRRHAGGIVAGAVLRSPIDDDTVIAPATRFVVRTDDAGGGVHCCWDGGALRLPAIVADALHHLAEAATPIAVSALPGLDAADRTTLVRRLADEGAVTVVDSVAPGSIQRPASSDDGTLAPLPERMS